MKRALLLTITLSILVSPGLGVVGHNGSGDGDVSITSSHGSAGATTSVGPNGTEYSVKVGMEGRTQNSTEDSIRSESISSSKVEFKGTITAATPCHVIKHEVSEKGDGYVLNIKTVKESQDNQMCTQVVSGINYNAEFEAENGFTLEVQHNGEEVETFQTVSDKEDKNKEESHQKSFLEMILSFFGF